ncbi:DUF3098 domain-containing protein [Weeksellaceae bacterium TAE3-ERU29]|nr:DUF3098 domain-containing protein [Weeksellaceae bacterium TAE3-ERU29]
MDEKIKISNQILFTKKNYILMAIGIITIALGFFLMTGADANTRPDGVFDPNYWNQDIFSWKRIRLAPTLVLIGFIIEIIAILYQPKNK